MSSVFEQKTDGGPPPLSLPCSVGANVVYALVMRRLLKHEAVKPFSTEWQSRDSGCEHDEWASEVCLHVYISHDVYFKLWFMHLVPMNKNHLL